MAEGLANRLPHNQSQDFSTTSSHNSSERSGSLSGWFHRRGWVRDGGVLVSSSPGRRRTSPAHFADRHDGACPLEGQRTASHWPLLKKQPQNACCKTSWEITGEASQPALVGAIANLALSHAFPDSAVHGARIFPHQSSVYSFPHTELHEEINISVELLTDSPLPQAVSKCCFSVKQLRNKCRALQDDWGFKNCAKSAYKENVNFMCVLHVILET